MALVLKDLDVGSASVVSLWVIVDILLVLVEADHLVDDWLGHLVQGCEGEWSDCYVHVAQFSNYRLQLGVVNSIEWFDNL